MEYPFLMAVRKNVLEAIGGTPLILLGNIMEKEGLAFSLYAKLERSNPSGSVKDRPAAMIVEDALRKGGLREGGTLVEATSGNMGISLAMACAVKKVHFVSFMPENASRERILAMRAFGAEVILSPASDGMKGSLRMEEEYLLSHPDAVRARQFENPENPRAHERTGKEIWEDLKGKVGVFLAGIGTGGTITGTASYLRSKDPAVKILGVEPSSSPLLREGRAGPHRIQGLGANFVPEVLDLSLVDEIVPVGDEEAYEGARRLAREEGILAGISSGAALIGILKARDRVKKGENAVILLPDGGERYLSVEGLYE